MFKKLSIFLCLMICNIALMADDYRFPLDTPEQTQEKTILSKSDESLKKLSHRTGMPLDELQQSNPLLDPSTALPEGTPIQVPAQFVPTVDNPRGIVIDTATRRLYFFSTQAKEVWIFPVAVGRRGWETPVGTSTVIEKQKDPVWFVPESIQRHMEEKGVFLPDVMAAGPHNPLGPAAIRTGLEHGTILIHGNNKADSVGRPVSSGCVRMHNDHILALFEAVEKGTPVQVVNQAPLG